VRGTDTGPAPIDVVLYGYTAEDAAVIEEVLRRSS